MDHIIRKIMQSYDMIVEEYYNNTKGFVRTQRIQRGEFLAMVPQGGRLLDLACGPGRDSKFFSEKGFQTVGVDISTSMLEKAKSIAPAAEFKVMDMLEMDLEPDSFDGVWFNTSLSSIEKKRAPKILLDINKLLVPEGALFISVRKGKMDGFELDPEYQVNRYNAAYSKTEITKLLHEAGFKVKNFFLTEIETTKQTTILLEFICLKKEA